MKTTTTHPFANNPHAPYYNPAPAPKEPYRILDYPSGSLLSVDIGDGDVLMDRDQAIELLEILRQAVPALLNTNQDAASRLNANNP